MRFVSCVPEAKYDRRTPDERRYNDAQNGAEYRAHDGEYYVGLNAWHSPLIHGRVYLV